MKVYYSERKAFTLAEVLGIMTAIGLIALISIPIMVNYQKSTKLRNEARLLATNIRLAQQLAITEQSIYAVKFNILNNSYEIIDQSSDNTIKEVFMDQEVSITEIQNFEQDTAQFIPNGAVALPGNIMLQNSKNTTSTVHIKPSGYVEITGH